MDPDGRSTDAHTRAYDPTCTWNGFFFFFFFFFFSFFKSRFIVAPGMLWALGALESVYWVFGVTRDLPSIVVCCFVFRCVAFSSSPFSSSTLSLLFPPPTLVLIWLADPSSLCRCFRFTTRRCGPSDRCLFCRRTHCRHICAGVVDSFVLGHACSLHRKPLARCRA